MTTAIYPKELLEGNYIIGGQVLMKDGIIKDNPFSKAVNESLAATWVLENEKKVKAKIKDYMIENRLGIHEVDECYDYAVYYFLEKDGRDFDPMYFGDSGSDTYNIDIYCLYKLKVIVYQYRNEMRPRLDRSVYIIDTDKDENENMPKNCISYNVLTTENSESEHSFEEIIEFEECQDIFDNELPLYNEDFINLGFNNFNFRSYVYYMFLSDFNIELDSDGFNLKEESLQKVSKALGLTPSALKKINRMIKTLVRSRKDVFKDVPEILVRLLASKRLGWKPKF